MNHRLHRLEQLVERYRLANSVQMALINLSELAGTLSDMNEFYPAIHKLVNQYLAADNFYVVLYEPQSRQYTVEYYTDEKDPIDSSGFRSEEFERGLTGYVIRTKQALLCDEQMFNHLVNIGEIEIQGTPSHHWLGVPLSRGSQVIGVMVAQLYDKTRDYVRKDIELLRAIATHTVVALDRVKSRELLEQTVRERTKQLQNTNQSLQREIKERVNAEKLQAALYKISELTASNNDTSSFYRQMHQVLCTLMPAENCYIALLDDSGKTLSFPFYVDQFTPTPQERPLRKGFTEYVLRVGEARLIDSELSEQLVQQGEVLRIIPESVTTVPLSRSWLGAPLLIEQQALGVIAVQSYDDSYLYTENELNILKFVSQHIAVAIQRKLNLDQQRQHQEELERKIFERTRELRQTNLFLRLQVEERKKAEEKLFHEANHDMLTGLANRQLFMVQMRQQFALRNRESNLNFSILFIDLDRFKLINDTMGHHAGDAFLIEISKRIVATVREHDLVARLGGDEFVVLLTQLNRLADAEDVADRIIEAVRQPMLLHGQQVFSGASIGIANYHPDYTSADALLRDADAAMYQAKALGRNRFVIFTDSMRMQLLQELSLEQALQQAVQDRQFGVAYQPIVDCSEQQVIGYAASLCWSEAKLGTAAEFSQYARSAGILPHIELQILEQLVGQLQGQSQPSLVSLTLSAQHLQSPVQFDRLAKILMANTQVMHRLCLGFAEFDLLKLSSSHLSYLHQLHRLGVRLSLDHFGAELMPIGLLSQYPFNFVRLDPVFARALVKQTPKQQILSVLMTLAQQFKFRIIADGVDDETLQSLLIAQGCCFMQGSWVTKTLGNAAIVSAAFTSLNPSLFLQQLA